MKIFKYYNAAKIARHIQIFFSGRIYIEGVGGFEFNYGKIQCPKIKNIKKLTIMSEINRLISQSRHQLAAV